MTRQAKSVTIPTFSVHPASYVSLPAVLFLIFSSLPDHSSVFPAEATDLARTIRSKTGGWPTIAMAWIFALTIHTLIALYVVRLTRIHTTRHRGAIVGFPNPKDLMSVVALWVTSAFVLGSRECLHYIVHAGLILLQRRSFVCAA
jgi:hypothetical protein